MELTIIVCLIIGITYLLLVLDGALCLYGVDEVCIIEKRSNIVIIILGSSTILPISLCLYAAWRDHHRFSSSKSERLRLLNKNTENGVEKPSRIRMYIYTSHFISAWGDYLWAFAIPILFMEIFVDTLLPSAVYSLVMYIMCIVLLPMVGSYLDKCNRWTAMKWAIVLENITIVASTSVLVAILLVTNADGITKPEWTIDLTMLFIVIVVLGGIGQVLSDAQTLSIERDWVVVIAGPDSSALVALNTALRRIDLSCKILGPISFSIIMDFAGEDPTSRALLGAATVGIWNLISTPLEYFMTRDVYGLHSKLALKEVSCEVVDFSTAMDSRNLKKTSTLEGYFKQWHNFLNHPIFLLSFVSSILYMTVLNRGGLNTAYLKWRGVSNSILGLSHAICALFGILGTFAFPYLRHCIGGAEKTAIFSVWLFWLFLVPTVIAFLLVGESQISDYVMLGSIAVSRSWLWTMDLAVTQIMQEWIRAGHRGSINAMQTATNSIFFIIICSMGIVWHDPRAFQALVLFSIVAVFSSVVGCTIWNMKYGRYRQAYTQVPVGR